MELVPNIGCDHPSSPSHLTPIYTLVTRLADNSMLQLLTHKSHQCVDLQEATLTHMTVKC